MHRIRVVFASLLFTVSVVSAQTVDPNAQPRRADGPGEASARNEAMRRYENLLASDSPALAGSRDEIMFRLGLLYLEDAQVTNPGVGGYGNRDRYERALALFQRVLTKPDSIFREDALYYQAIAFEETGRPEQALTGFRTIAHEFPASARASELYFRLGNDAVQKNRIAEAATDYQEVLRRGDPRYRDQSSYMYAWSAFALRQSANARVTLIDLLQRLEGAGQQKIDLYNEAIELLAKVIRSEGSTAPLSGPWVGPKPAFAPIALRRTADLFKETSGFREAAMAYEQLERDYPDPASADTLDKLVIECYAKAGDAERAEEARERLVGRHVSGGKIVAASAAEVAPIVKDSALYLHQRARATKQQDFYRRAVQAYQIYADTVGDGPRWDALFLQADALKDLGDLATAADRYKAISEARDPTHGEESAFRRIALLEDAKSRGLSDVTKLLGAYEDYFRLFPGGPHEVELRNREAGYLFDEKRYADALVAGGAVVNRITAPADRQKLELMLARAAFQAGDYPQSANWIGKLITEPNLPAATKTDADQIRAAAILKSAEAMKDRPLDAASQYELLARLYPQHPSAAASLYNAAIIYKDQGDKNRALGLLRTLVETYPKADLARDATAAADDLYKQNGDSAGAADFLARAATATSGNPSESANLLYEAASRARAGNSTAQAVDLYDKYLKLRPPNDLRAATAKMYLAKQYERQGRDAEAERIARETLATTPMTGTPQEIQQVQLLLAEARLIIGNASLRRFEQIRLVEPLAASLKRKQAAMDQTVEDLRAAAAYGFADVSLASLYKIGYAQLDFANAVMQAPRPKTLGADQRQQYDAALQEQMRPYREGAEKAFRMTLEQAKTAGIENEWTARARASLVEFGDRPTVVAPTSGQPPAAPILVPPTS